MKNSEDNYYLEVGKKGEERLNILNQIINDSSCKFLLKMGLKSGMKILELGCGTGQMAIWLAKQVMPQGTVIAIDNSTQQIEIAQKSAQEAGVNNIEFHVISVKNIDSLDLNNKIDLVFARFLFAHLTERQSVLNTVKNVLKLETGIIVLQEPISSQKFCYPENPALNQLTALSLKVNQYFNKDFNLGMKLGELYKNAGLKVLDCQYHDSLSKTKNEKLQFYRSLEEAEPTVLKYNLATKEELNIIKEGLKALAEDDHVMVSGMPNIIIGGINVEMIGDQNMTVITDLE
ncbi:MAG TPA: class I SAM-dependent methyltransferase [Rickettsia endosymbiont of Omalisus fontisbellaquei]|nr:class I SAM-dependent methyltransferase [Rickettsia endosymbiont of Omalisus fontisbellaquei]